MLEELHIRDVGIIDDVTVNLAPGLNVLTGETGAGKTMVVSALQLLLGGRADADRVRAGADAALVEGRFRPPPAGADNWLGAGDDELVVAREVATGGASGRSRARISGRLAPASALAETVGMAVEIHGQGDSALLSTPAVQRELLDRAGGASLTAAVEAYRDLYARRQTLASDLHELLTGARDRARELDRLRFELAEIDAVDPVTGEEQELETELRRLEHAEVLRSAAAAAAAAVTDEGGARDGLGAAVAALRGVSGVDEALDALGRRADGVAAETQELALELTSYAHGVELDPSRLAELRDRRGALASLTRKYGTDAAAVAEYAEQTRRRICELAAGDDRAGELETRLAALEGELLAAAGRLSKERRAAAGRLAGAVTGHLADLGMPAAALEVALEAVEPGPYGAERVRFLLSAGPGQPVLPLAKAASGGERSRVALAVRLALLDGGPSRKDASADNGPVLVFDEVDAGIGGATALDVGRKLARLAEGGRHQVLCVTHLAQLAAFADAHFVVRKDGAERQATVRRVRGDERIAELARMLSGAVGSDTAMAHAAELRDAAAAVRAAEASPRP